MTDGNLVFVSFYDGEYALYIGVIVCIISIMCLMINLNKVENQDTKAKYKIFIIFLFLFLYIFCEQIELIDMVENTTKTETYKVVQGKN